MLEHYKIGRHQGSGGMGVVYRAEDITLGRPVALKFLTSRHEEIPELYFRQRQFNRLGLFRSARSCDMFWNKKPRIRTHVYCWRTTEAYKKGLVADIQKARGEPGLIVVLAHFSSAHEWITQELAACGISCQALSNPAELTAENMEKCYSEGIVAVVPFQLLQHGAYVPLAGVSFVDKTVVVVPDVYPSASRDAMTEEFASTLSSEVTVSSYTAFTTDLVRSLDGENILRRLEKVKLGPWDDERMEHPWLKKAVCRRQGQFSELVPEERPAKSPEEWFQLNAPSLSASFQTAKGFAESGNKYFAQSEYEEAIACYEKALKHLHRRDYIIDCWSAIATAWLRHGEPARSIDYFERVHAAQIEELGEEHADSKRTEELLAEAHRAVTEK